MWQWQVDYYAWWELVTGCTPVSSGCKNCFGRSESKLLQEMGLPRYKDDFKFTIHEKELEKIHLLKKKNYAISICPISDLFHKKVPDELIFEVFKIIRQYSNWSFKISTKRSERLLEISHRLPKGIPNNVSLTVSVENIDQYYRIDHLRQTYMPHGGRKAISIAPILSAMPDLPLEGIGEVGVDSERGENARPANNEWIEDINKQCKASMATLKQPIFFRRLAGKPLTPPPRYYFRAMITNLIESTHGMMIFPLYPINRDYRKSKYFELYSKYRQTPFPYDELKAKVRQVAPEFFEP